MKSALRYYIFAGVCAVGVVTLSHLFGMFSGIEQFLEDRLQTEVPARNDIVVVAIDDASLASLGQWPWSRATHAALLRAIDAQVPTAIAVDVVFADASMRGSEDDAMLASALRSLHAPIVLAAEGRDMRLEGENAFVRTVMTPREVFLPSSVAIGHVNIITDADSVARRVPLSLMQGTVEFPSLAREVLIRAGISSSAWPTVTRIKYTAQAGTLPTVSAADLLRGTSTLSLAHKIVFVGVTAPDLHDSLATPLSRGSLVPGVEIQAQIARMLMEGERSGYLLRDISWYAEIVLFLLNAVLLFVLFYFARRLVWPIVASCALLFAWLVIAVVAFDKGYVLAIVHLELSVIVSALAYLFVRYALLDKAKRDLRHAFSKYVSRDVLDEILRDPRGIKLGGEEYDATIMFSDVRGFTTLSESMTASQLVTFLNRYLTRMTDIILERRGVVDKYIGDAIMAFWGAPLRNEHHALEAIQTSLAMIDALHDFNEESARNNEAPIDIGVGLNSGTVVAGNMGSHQRFDYTVMGDTVNLSSRLEGQTKTYGIRILVSENTIESAGGIESLRAHGVYVREIDRIAVKGKKLPVRVFEIVEGRYVSGREAVAEDFEFVRNAYYAGSFAEAVRRGRILCERYADDSPLRVIVERCEYFVSHPPEKWEGAYTLKTK